MPLEPPGLVGRRAGILCPSRRGKLLRASLSEGILRHDCARLKSSSRCNGGGAPGHIVALGLAPRLRTQHCKESTLAGHLRSANGRHERARCPQPLQAASMAPLSAGSQWMEIGAIVLGYVVVFGACFRNVPQIMRVVKNKSAKGISVTSLLVDTATITITAAYNFCKGYQFSTYGEMVVLWFQNNLLLAAMFKYNESSLREMAAISAAMVLGTWWLMAGGCPMHILSVLQGTTVFVSAVASRVPQIMLNIKNRGSGELSIITYLLNVLGCAARVLTTLALTGDMLLLAGMALQFVLNGVLLYQTLETAGVVKRPKTPGLQP